MVSINKYRAYRCSGELYTSHGQKATPERTENLLLWLLNGHYHGGEYSVRMEFGSYATHGGLIQFSGRSPGRFEFSDVLYAGTNTSFKGRGSLATANSPRSEDDDDLTTQTISLSFSKLTDETSVQIELAPSADAAGGLVELTDAQRTDLSFFLECGNPERGMQYDVTELVYPDGTERAVDTYDLQANPDAFAKDD